jgi:zinc protease
VRGATVRHRVRRALIAAILASAITALALPSQALNVEVIKSTGGIEAWLVRESAVPLVAIGFAFEGGTGQDPSDKPGVANMVSALLDEGAGPYDARAFHQALDERAVQFQFTAGRDHFRGSMRVLNEHRAGAFDLLRLMLTEPRFDPPAVERIRRQIQSALQRDSNRPGEIAARAWWSTAFPGHPYGQPVKGTAESVERITIDDLKAYRERVFARDRLKVTLIGDLTPEAAGKLIDETFGGLAATGQLAPVADVAPQGIGGRIVHDVDVPQASVVFGGTGIPRKDPDFIAGYVVNHILGGGSVSSRLYDEVREKRGLAYSVHGSLVWLKHAASVVGSTATRAERTAEALTIIEREIARMRDEGPTDAELEKAKAYLKGSYALNFDTSSKIVSLLLQMQIDDLGVDYVEKRNELIEAVTREDAKRAAGRMFDGGLLVTVAGRPRGLTSKAPGGSSSPLLRRGEGRGEGSPAHIENR